MTAPLEGIRVVEIASYVAAPAAGALLADLGADVVKVEVPQGEVYRHSRPKVLGFESDFPEAPHFQMDNRGKRSLALDLTKPAAREGLLRVIDAADIVITNMLPHRLEKFGLDAKTLRSRRPELIFGAMSGYGRDGPDATTPAFDYTAYWSRTGFMDQMHEPDSPPAFLRPGVGDHAAALSLVTGILSALRMRDRSGEGQVVDVSLMHMGFYIQGNDAALTLATRQNPPRHDRRGPRNPLWNHYQTQDGRWLFLVMIESDRYWATLCEALKRPEWVDDERFNGAVPRYRNKEALVDALAPVFAEKSLAEWVDVLGMYTLIWAPVNTLLEAVDDPQARASGIFANVQHPTAGNYETVSPPVRLSAYPMKGDRPGPELGAHAREVLAEAGLSDEEIDAALD